MITDAILEFFNRDATIKRDVVKTISWRMVGTVDTALLGWLVSGRLAVGLKIGGLELVTKMILYFFHERIWHKINFGRHTRQEAAAAVKAHNKGKLFRQPALVKRAQREQLNNFPAFTLWLTGLSGSGKSTRAAQVDKWLFDHGLRAYILDGDNTRLGINSDLSFTTDDRKENIRRTAEICKLFNDAGMIVIASFISPFNADRQMAKAIIGESSFIMAYIDTDIALCRKRDVKGLYKLADEGKIKDFTGVGSPFEPPADFNLQVPTDRFTVQESCDVIVRYLLDNRVITQN